ncbi:MAG: isopeptide-forming domain-containing fimbrial protein [Anaerolineales bacterium]
MDLYHGLGLLLCILSLFSQAFGAGTAVVQARPLSAGVPSVSLDVPSQVMIGEDFSFTVTFDNAGDQTGYGPFIDVVLPANGADGNAGADTPDGIFYDAGQGGTYLGNPLDCQEATFDASGEVQHPFYRDADGNYVTVTGTPGDTFVSCKLPFGSFVTDQPPAAVTFQAAMSSLADVGTALPIRARGGFLYGEDPLDNWCCDVIAPNPSSHDSSTWTGPNQADVEPTLLRLEKTYSGPEGETATGPNFPRQFTITVDVAQGQTVTDLEIGDILPDNLQFLSLDSISGNGTGLISEVSTPGLDTPDGTLSRRLDRVDGTTSAVDAEMSFSFYVPRDDLGGTRVLNSTTGDDVASPNNAYAEGDWTPVDPRDPGGVDNVSAGGVGSPAEYTLTDKSLAIQKGVTNLTDSQNSPGDILEYTLAVQVSDFFAFDGVEITDVVSDGQHVVAGYPPELQVEGNGFSYPASDMDGANLDVICNYSGTQGSECTAPDPDPNDGTTRLVFRISDELISRGRPDGNLLGGCVPPGGGTADCDTVDDGPTTLTLTFRTRILEDFRDDIPSGDESVDQGDTFSNEVDVRGEVLDNTTLTATGESEADSSSAGLAIGRGGLSKSIYAVNGSTTFSMPVNVQPGDQVTFRVSYDLTTSDVEDLYFLDYLPLPVLDVEDPDADNAAGPAWVFDNDGVADIPALGHADFGPADTFYAYSSIVPTLTSNSAANRLRFEYGDFDSTANQPTTVDLLFTVAVNNQPYADGLYFTNQSLVHEGSTNAGNQTTEAVVDFILNEPFLVHDKGAVASDNPNAEFSDDPPGPVTFDPPGSGGLRWTGTISSDLLEDDPIDSDISGVDAGDLVSFALVIENQGSSDYGAFDIRIRDIIPAGFSIPGGGSGLNLSVYRGDGDPVNYSPLGPNYNDTDLFDEGLEIVDPDPNQGACQTYHPTDGTNLILLVYDLEVDPDVEPGLETENLSTLFQYANTEGGPDFTGDDADLEDEALTTIASPDVSKTRTDTSLAFTSGNEVAVGEYVSYETVIAVPEGESANVTLVDTLDRGLAFGELADMDIVVSDPGAFGKTASDFDDILDAATITSQGSGDVNHGRVLTVDFGTLTNADRDNGTAETITLTYDVVVINSGNNDRGGRRNNSAVWSWGPADDRYSTSDSASNVRIVEPTLQVDKDPFPTSGDYDDEITFTITVSHAGSSNADAFDLVLSDTVPDDMTYVGGSFSHTAGRAPTTADSVGPDLGATWDSFPLGSTSTFTFQATLNDDVSPGQTITNSAELTWESLEDEINSPQSTNNPLSTERTGDETDVGGSANDYRASGSADVTVTTPTVSKELLDTNQPFTAGTQVAVGEQVQYRVTVIIPEGQSASASFEDVLDPGLAFVSCDQITASPVLSAEQGFDCVNAAFSEIPGGSTAEVNQSRSMAVDFGLITNSDTDNDTAETVTIDYTAVVLNAGPVQRGNTLGNTVDWSWDSSTETETGPALTVVEPLLTAAKTASPSSGDAGDVINFEITLSASSAANTTNAYEVDFADLIPDGVSYVGGLSCSTSAGLAVPDTCAEAGGTVSVSWSGGGKPFAPGESAVVSFDAALDSDVAPAQVITNQGDLDWTGLPGDVTGPQTARNGLSVERTGDSADVGGVENDYRDSGSADVTVDDVVVDKYQPDPEQYTLGEEVTFEILFTMPEGAVQDLEVGDDIPAGMLYVDHELITSASQSSLLSADYLGPLPSRTENNPTGPGDDLSLQFNDDVVTAADNDPDNDRFVLQITLLVLNVSGNQDGTVLTDVGRASYTDAGGGTNTSTGSADVEVIEPDLILVKTADDDTPTLGQTVTYTLVVDHSAASNADGFDLVLTDTIPSGMDFVSGSLTLPPGWSAETTGLPDLSFSADALALGEGPATLSYQAVVEGPPSPPAPGPGDDLPNTANLTWHSRSGSHAEERTGDDQGGAAPENDYRRADTETATLTNIDLRVEKSGPAVVEAGDLITYTLAYANDGNTGATGVVVTDQIPEHTTFEAASSSPGWSCAGGTCTFAMGSLAAGGSGTLTFAVRLDDPLPAGVDQILNTASVTDDGDHGPEPTPENNQTEEISVTADATPDLSVQKDDGVDYYGPGGILVYTLTYQNAGNQDTTGVSLEETVPAGTTFAAEESTPGWIRQGTTQPCQTGDPAGTTCVYDVGDLGAGLGTTSVLFALEVEDPLDGAVTEISNTVTISDDGLNGPDQNPGDNTDTDIDLPASFDKSWIESNQTFTAGQDGAIGEILTYRLQLEIPAQAGTGELPNLVIRDELERGLGFVDCLEISASSGLSTDLAGGFGAVCAPDPTDPAAGNPAVIPLPPGNSEAVNQGRALEFELGNVTHTGQGPETITLLYRAAILDAEGSGAGTQLTNAAEAVWRAGDTSNRLEDQAPQVSLLEPDFTINKRGSERTVFPDMVVTFTLEVAHSAESGTDGFDVVLTDELPAKLRYLSGSLRVADGLAATMVDESDPRLLRMVWDTFPLGENATIQFKARVGQVRPEEKITNTAYVAWTSLPGDVSDSQSAYNDLARERTWDPAAGVGLVSQALDVLPLTGFPPGQVTELPEAPKEALSSMDMGDMQLIVPALDLSLPVIGVPLTEGGWDIRWLSSRAGYLEGSAYPTWQGNTVLTGHAVLPTGYPGPFTELGSLGWDDEIILFAHGQKYIYHVRDNTYVAPEDFSILEHKKEDWLTLFTCYGYDEIRETYRWRQVVRAVLIRVEVLD